MTKARIDRGRSVLVIEQCSNLNYQVHLKINNNQNWQLTFSICQINLLSIMTERIISLLEGEGRRGMRSTAQTFLFYGSRFFELVFGDGTKRISRICKAYTKNLMGGS